MTNILVKMLQLVPRFLPFLALAFASWKINLPKKRRDRQIYMPIISAVICLIGVIAVAKLRASLQTGLKDLVNAIEIAASGAANAEQLIAFLNSLLRNSAIFMMENVIFMAIYLALKTAVMNLLRLFNGPKNEWHRDNVSPFYDEDPELQNDMYLREVYGHARTYLMVFYIAVLVIGMLATLFTCCMVDQQKLQIPFSPVVITILAGELFFALNGITKREAGEKRTEKEKEVAEADFSGIRDLLRRLFVDKLNADNMSDTGETELRDSAELVQSLVDSTDPRTENYGLFMQKKQQQGLEIDRGYLAAGLDILRGKSILFNNPFYYDMIPYIFYPMNDAILRHRRVLILVGRHGEEVDAEKWCVRGLTAVDKCPELWRVGVLTREEQDLEVGIIPMSRINDLKLLEANAGFISETEMVVILEPSKLLTSSQIGLNTIVRLARREDKKTIFVSMDKNCDGLLDALSHLLMTSLTEVSATNHHTGISTYMCWDADSDHLSHRLLPDISRYLGFGTELSFAALREKALKTYWYGGKTFPVTDIAWIDRQYYFELLNYAGLPVDQDVMQDHFVTSSDLWSATREKKKYVTVEDEDCNVFEMRREFSTRALEEGFVNIISPDYLLKDYMTGNERLFNTDSKAIPNIVSDYAHTRRNVVLRNLLRMGSGAVWESDIVRELLLLDADSTDVKASFWHEVCQVYRPVDYVPETDPKKAAIEKVRLTRDGKEYTFFSDVIQVRHRYNTTTSRMENSYSISDSKFTRIVIDDLRNIEYIAEDENEDGQYLGTEIRGQLFQKYLPGQFLTIAGKHYEMLRVSEKEHVIIRRAADHITGRPQYRQYRDYTIRAIKASEGMGDLKAMPGLQRAICYADYSVDTPAYYRMGRYHDFTKADLIYVNGIPTRDYINKKLLMLTFEEGGDEVTPARCATLASLMNEVFRTLFPDNNCYIVATTAGDWETPVTNHLKGGENCVLEENAIYIIEDSQMDIGLLETVDRNLDRIFNIIADYLEWNEDVVDKSKNPSQPVQYELPAGEGGETTVPEKKRSWIVRMFRAIGRFFKKIWMAIVWFFKKLFGKKPKPEPEGGNGPAGTAEGGEGTAPAGAAPEGEAPEGESPEGEAVSGTAPAGETPEGAVVSGTAPAGEAVEITPEGAAETVEAAPEGEAAEEVNVSDENTEADAPEAAETTEVEETTEAVDASTLDAPVEIEPNPNPGNGEEDWGDESGDTGAASETTAEADIPTGFNSIRPSIRPRVYFSTDEQGGVTMVFPDSGKEIVLTEAEQAALKDADEAQAEAVQAATVEETAAVEAEAAPEAEPKTLKDGEAEPTGDQEFEGDDAVVVKPQMAEILMRAPYHERYYLLYGGTAEPAQMDYHGVLEMLRKRGYDHSELKQAREGENTAEMVARTFVPGVEGKHYCDFCGDEITGKEYEVLKDGRERCKECSRTAIRTEKQFRELYRMVYQKMQARFGISINVPISVKMVNSKRLHKAIGESFVPTGHADGRVLGVAIRKGSRYTLYLENGAPRVASMMTMAHELTHIWQYNNWNDADIKARYGKYELEVYEGMAKWVEIQFTFLMNEPAAAMREQIMTLYRDDEYGRGFIMYLNQYPISETIELKGRTPFMNRKQPLK